MSLEKLRAMAAENTKSKPAAIAAAVDRQLKAMTRDLARAGVELNSVGKISASSLSRSLAAVDVPAQKRIEIKIALDRAGLLGD